MRNSEGYAEQIRNKLGQGSIEQLGYICKDINLYTYIDKMELGKSLVGKEMDKAGRWMFNHRFAEGHLWWKELTERPINQWGDVIEHLASDIFTRAGLPYAFDGSMIRGNRDLLRLFSPSKSIDNWAMINGFEFIAGSSSLIFSIYDAKHLKNGYHSDLALAMDGLFVALNVAGGISTANPLLIISALIKSSTMIRKFNRVPGIHSSSPFDVDIDELLHLNKSYDVSINSLIGTVNTFDFLYDSKRISF